MIRWLRTYRETRFRNRLWVAGQIPYRASGVITSEAWARLVAYKRGW